jgi:hypothetical protein
MQKSQESLPRYRIHELTEVSLLRNGLATLLLSAGGGSLQAVELWPI